MSSQLGDQEVDHRTVLRPVQFMGNKSRILDPVVAAITGDLKPGANVWEPFTGSSVVAQALAFAGHTVTATDALNSSVCFARALLGVDRGFETELESVPNVVLEASSLREAPSWAMGWLTEEDEAVYEGDGHELIRLGTLVPQTWREPVGRGPGLSGRETRIRLGPIASNYAGTYFGLRQAWDIDNIRSAIQEAIDTRSISKWWVDVLLTALCSAASAAVFSAGKHFAQPINTAPGKVLDFHARRIAQDRGVDVREKFAGAIVEITTAVRPAGEGHDAHHLLVESVDQEFVRKREVQAIYADPPYTAQQYSRFYHLLETIVSGAWPALQMVRDAPTSGLYPIDRYKSPFCSRRQAPGAFEGLVRLAKESNSRLVLSYSMSDSGVTGNARTIQLDELVSLFRGAFGTKGTRVERLELTYRQFNHSSLAVKRRDDVEVMIVGQPNAR